MMVEKQFVASVFIFRIFFPLLITHINYISVKNLSNKLMKKGVIVWWYTYPLINQTTFIYLYKNNN
jgi:hypothetical protein